MYFHKPRNGCQLEWKSEGATRYSETSMEEADALLKSTKIILDDLIIDLLFTFEFGIGRIKKKEEDLKKFYESLKSLLKNKGQLLETKEIGMQVHRISQAAELLEFVNPKSLKTITITTRITIYSES
ncbi:hypothetical protein CAEBREN_10727 [Caenorhabditis brenneri]|uniref:DUF38 domain-containing protein n=1 Tax=Caenorhabditis brenneri TaxID=135651 RepID=G0NSX2_CAEBE|nr:hypothetical protein CAEBREN_10727 [Caenorhabditis brenneri]